MSKLLILFTCLTLFLSGCTSTQQRKNEAIAKGVYAAQDALRKGRVDLTSKYLNETVRLVAPPKKREDFKSFNAPFPTSGAEHLKNIDYVILPSELSNKPVIVEESKEYKDLVSKNIELSKQIEEEKKNLDKFEKNIDKTVRDIQEATQEKKKGVWGWLMAAISSFGLIGILIVAIFFPATLPVILSVAKTIFNLVLNWIKMLIDIIGGVIKK